MGVLFSVDRMFVRPQSKSGVSMRTKYAPVFAIALALGWSAPDPREPGFGISAEARVKSRAHKRAERNHHRAVGKRQADKAAVKRPAVPSKHALVAQASPPSSSPSLDLPIAPTIPAIPMSPPPDRQVLTRDQQMEKLRLGLERLAKTIAAPEDYMEQLRRGLEKRAKAMNEGGI